MTNDYRLKTIKALDLFYLIYNTLNMESKRVLYIYGVLIIAFLYVLMRFYPMHMGLERILYDVRDWMKIEFGEVKKKQDIIIVDIDDKSLKELGRLQNWPRFYFGMVINEVSSQNPSVIGIDIIFSESDSIVGYNREISKSHLIVELSSIITGIDSTTMDRIVDATLSTFSFDSYLSSSLRKANNVALAAYLTDEISDRPAKGYEDYLLNFPPPKSAKRYEGMVTPIPEFLENAEIGVINSMEDRDGVERKRGIFFNYKDRTVPSFAFSIAKNVAGSYSYRGRRLIIGGRHIWLDEENLLWINYQGPFETFEYISFVDLLKGDIPGDIFMNKIVLFGSSSPGLSDLSQVPFGGKLPSIELHANIIHNLLYSEPIKKASEFYTIIFVALIVFLILWLSNKLSPYFSSVILLVLMVGYFLFVLVQYLTYFVDFEITRPLLAMVFSFIGGLSFRINRVEKEKRHIRNLFSRYVPAEAVNEIIQSSKFSLEGERREVSVLISDIRDFTTRAEREEPENIVLELNDYFEEMADIIFEHGGMIDKYLGDGILCIFGAPIFHPAHADRALSCAVAMQFRLRRINQGKIKEGKTPIIAGIAINSGDAVIGNIGSNYRADYTAIGDVVNTAARLEPLNKEYMTEILITEATKSRLKGNYKIESVGKVQLKGKREPTAIYAVSPE
jgi:adenylate cyclase